MSGSGMEAFDPENMSFDSVSTDNSEEFGEGANRNYVPCGVGVTVTQTEEGPLRVLGVVNGSALTVGDLLLEINGVDVTAKPKEDVAAMLQGRAGTSIQVEILRSGERVKVKLTRHYKARRGATRQQRQASSSQSPRQPPPRSPRSPASGGSGGSGGWMGQSSPSAAWGGGGREPPPRNAASPKQPLAAPTSGGSQPPPPMPPPGSSARRGVVEQLEAMSAGLSASVVSPAASSPSGQRSFDPERSFASDKSFDPEKELDRQILYGAPARVQQQGGGGRVQDAHRRSPPAEPNSGGSAASRHLAMPPTEASFDPSEKSFDPEAAAGRGSRGGSSRAGGRGGYSSERSFDPEASMSQSEQSFDPEASPANSRGPSVNLGSQASIDSTSDRRAAQQLEGMSVLLRQAIAGKKVPGVSDPMILEHDGTDAMLGGGGVDGFDGDARDSTASGRVCSTVASFDPEASRSRPVSDKSRASYASHSSFDPERSGVWSGTGSPPVSVDRRTGGSYGPAGAEPSFDPSQSSMFQGPEYDPSVDFRGRPSWGFQQQSFDPERSEFDPEATPPPSRPTSYRHPNQQHRPGSGGGGTPQGIISIGSARSASEASFDPERSFELRESLSHPAPRPNFGNNYQQEHRQSPPRQHQSSSPSGHYSRPKSVWGATVGVELTLEDGRFVVESTKGKDAGDKVRVGDEVVKVDGLVIHGMLLGQVHEMLAGPEGSRAELEVRQATPEGTTKVVMLELPRVAAGAAGRGGPAATLPPRVSAKEGGDAAAAIESVVNQARMVEDDLKKQVEEKLQQQAMERERRERAEADVVDRDALIGQLRAQIMQAADFNERASLAEEAKDKELQEARDTISRLQKSSQGRGGGVEGDRGIGATLARRIDGAYTVTGVEAGARSDGLEPGQVVLQVDGISVFGMEESEVAALVCGPAGTIVELQVGDGAKVWRTETRRVGPAIATPPSSGGERGTREGGSQRGSEQVSAGAQARMRQLEGLVLGLTRQVERCEASEGELRHELNLKGMQLESALGAMARVESRTEEMCLAVGAGQSAGKGWEAGLEGIARTAHEATEECRMLRAKDAHKGQTEGQLGALQDVLSELQQVEAGQFERALAARQTPALLQGCEAFVMLRNLLTEVDARTNKLANSSDRAQYASVQHQRSRSLGRQRSRGRVGRVRSMRSTDMSFDPSDYGDDPNSSDDDEGGGGGGRVRRRPSRMSTRSEMSFDPSVYAGDYDDDEFEGLEDDECGVGASLRAGPDGRAEIIGLVNGGPAQASGLLQVGDTVLKIDGVSADKRTHSELVDMVMGPPGSVVELEIERESDGVRQTIEVRRQTTARREGSSMRERSEMSFDPTEFGGSSDEEDEDGSESEAESDGGECGIGVSVAKDERGFYRITEVVQGGAAELNDALRVGDILRSVDGHVISVDFRKQDVMDLIRGAPGTAVKVDTVRDGKILSATVQRDTEDDSRVWRVLSEYSFAHPEEFGSGLAQGDTSNNTSTAANTSGGGGGGGQQQRRPAGSASDPSSSNNKAGQPQGAVEALKRQLMERNDDLGALQSRVEEAENAKGELLMKINELLARAQEEKAQQKQAQAPPPPPPGLLKDPTVAAPPRASESQRQQQQHPDQLEHDHGEGGGGDAMVGGGGVVDAQLGVGIVFKADRKGFYKVVELAPGGSAQRSRCVRVGDILLMANGASVKNMPQSRLAQLLLGTEGSTLELGLQRVDDNGLLYVTNVQLRRGPVEGDGQHQGVGQGFVRHAMQGGVVVGGDHHQHPGGGGAGEMQEEAAAAPPPVDTMCGVGITFGRDKKGFFVVKALAPNGPAALAQHILVHDTLVAVDGKNVKGSRYDELTPMILGPEGSLVVLSLRRAGGTQVVDVHLRRARVGIVGRTRRPAAAPSTLRPRSSEMQSILSKVPEEDAKFYSHPDEQQQQHGGGGGTVDEKKWRSTMSSNAQATNKSQHSHQHRHHEAGPGFPGQKCGVGLTFRVDDVGYYRVVERDASLSNEAGTSSVEIGDALVRVEGRLVKGMGHAQLGLLVLGPMGTQLTVLMQSAYSGLEYPLVLSRCKPVLDARKMGGRAAAGDGARASGRGSQEGVTVCGIGASFVKRGEMHYVESVVPGGSAFHSGMLHPGDSIVQLEGRSVATLSEDQLDELIQGPERSSCCLLVRTPAKNIHEIRLVRSTAGDRTVMPEKTGFATADGWDADDQTLEGFGNQSSEIIGLAQEEAPSAHRLTVGPDRDGVQRMMT